MQSRIERSLLDSQQIIGPFLDPTGDRVAVRRLQGERLEDHHVERAAEQFKPGLGHEPSSLESLWVEALYARLPAFGKGLASATASLYRCLTLYLGPECNFHVSADLIRRRLGETAQAGS